MTAYYNEFDPKTAAWLRQLIKNGVIAPGEVDERSITDVTAEDLRGFTQHHFFAGIGTWSYALRNAGWSDNRPVCTASLPCQPFSAAGNRKGKDDERHLLPHFIELVRQCDFDIIFGEQVEAAIRHGWLDDLQANMEAEDYAIGHAVLGAHSVNAPHQRLRLYWMAYAFSKRQEGKRWEKQEGIAQYSQDSRMGDSEYKQHERCVLGCEEKLTKDSFWSTSEFTRPSPIDYTDIDWLECQDGKQRPIKSGLKPLVDGLARGVRYSGGAIDPNNTGLARTIRLKGYGNAIHAGTAQLFIESAMEAINQ